MPFRRAFQILDRSAARRADGLIRNCGVCALAMARDAARANRDGDEAVFWARVLARVETRSGRRP